MSQIPATVIVLTCNEAANIRHAWKVCRPSGRSSWSTPEARTEHSRYCESGFRVRVLEHPFEDFGQQRNWALDHAGATQDWILFLDADERCTPACAESIRAAVEAPSGHVGFFLCYRNMFLGRWIKRCTMFPTWQLRLLRRGHVRYRKEGHGQRELMSGTAGYVKEPYEHFGFSKGVKDWIARHNDYSSNEIDLIETLRSESVGLARILSRDPVRRRRTLKAVAARVPLRPFVRFIYLYFLRFGFLDGRAGFMFCLLRLAHECHIVVKRAEMHALSGERLSGAASTSVARKLLT